MFVDVGKAYPSQHHAQIVIRKKCGQLLRMKIKLLNIKRIYRLIFRKARRYWICRFCFRFLRLI